jgi:WD40 repeat protein
MTLRLWDLQTQQQRLLIHGHENGADSLSFSPDGQLLASGGRDNLLKVWDATTGEMLASFKAHSKPVMAVAFSPDGTCLASGSGDNTIRLRAIT